VGHGKRALLLRVDLVAEPSSFGLLREIWHREAAGGDLRLVRIVKMVAVAEAVGQQNRCPSGSGT